MAENPRRIVAFLRFPALLRQSNTWDQFQASSGRRQAGWVAMSRPTRLAIEPHEALEHRKSRLKNSWLTFWTTTIFKTNGDAHSLLKGSFVRQSCSAIAPVFHTQDAPSLKVPLPAGPQARRNSEDKCSGSVLQRENALIAHANQTTTKTPWVERAASLPIRIEPFARRPAGRRLPVSRLAQNRIQQPLATGFKLVHGERLRLDGIHRVRRQSR